jgi:ADP-ribose pyrophosphatase
VATGSPAYDRGAFRQIGERARYSGERLNVVVGTFVGPDGFTFEREIVRIVRQYRGPVDQALLELPAGKLDVAGEAPEHCAARELNEEVGMKAERFTELGHFYNSPGFCDELTVCFLAEELRAGERAADGVEEEHLVVERIALSSVDELVATGDIADAKTIAGLFLTRSLLSTARPGDPLG